MKCAYCKLLSGVRMEVAAICASKLQKYIRFYEKGEMYTLSAPTIPNLASSFQNVLSPDT